jgi:hypothetical protein
MQCLYAIGRGRCRSLSLTCTHRHTTPTPYEAGLSINRRGGCRALFFALYLLQLPFPFFRHFSVGNRFYWVSSIISSFHAIVMVIVAYQSFSGDTFSVRAPLFLTLCAARVADQCFLFPRARCCWPAAR